MKNKILTNNSIQYVINHLLSVAMPRVNVTFSFSINEDVVKITILLFDEKQIVFHLINIEQIELLLKHQLGCSQLPSFDSNVNIPVFFTNNNSEFATIIDDTLNINADILTLSFIILSRYEETLIKKRDKYGRFEYENSLACNYNFIDIPIVDEYAMLLRKSLLEFIPNLKVEKRIGKVIPTHDIDEMLRFGDFLHNFKTIIGGDLITRKNLRIAYKSLIQAVLANKNKLKDPYIMAIERFIELSSQSGLRSEFYFKGMKTGENDCTYDINIPEVRYCMDKISEAGMIVGIHGGFDSFNNEYIFKQEKERVESVFGAQITYGRQHFLRFDIEKTIQIWGKNDIKHDSTLGFHEREGFRCGTCHEYYLYDLKNDIVSTVKARPLVAMDITLFEYRMLNIKTAFNTLNKLYDRCQAVEGDFIILWHNRNVYRDYEKRFNEVYRKFIGKINR